MDVSNYLAGGGVSGAIVVCAYFLYKCFYRKKFRSRCCNSSVDISEDTNVPPSPDKTSPKIQIPK
jgi:hypothetical protein